MARIKFKRMRDGGKVFRSFVMGNALLENTMFGSRAVFNL
jgi:hypothetical protein